MIQRLENEPKVEDVSIYNPPIEIETETPSDPQGTNKDNYVSWIRNGVEVVDVKAIEKKKPKLDKFGIPIQPGEHKNFDRI